MLGMKIVYVSSLLPWVAKQDLKNSNTYNCMALGATNGYEGSIACNCWQLVVVGMVFLTQKTMRAMHCAAMNSV